MGWRIPFLVGGPLGLVGLYLRTRVRETPVFTELAESDETESEYTGTFRDLWVDYKRPLFALAGLVVALNVTNYTLLER